MKLLVKETLLQNLHTLKKVEGNRLFKREFGYKSFDVGNKKDLKKLLNQIDNIVYVKSLSNGKIRFGGRQFSNYSTKSISLENVANLYQIDNSKNAKKYLNRGFSLDPRLQKKNFTSELNKILDGDEDAFLKWFNESKREHEINKYLLGIYQTKKEIERLLGLENLVDEIKNDKFEKDFNSFLNGTSDQNNEKSTPKISLTLQRKLGITDEEINTHVNEVAENTLTVLNKYEERLRIINRELLLDSTVYYGFRTYLRGTLKYDLSPTGDNSSFDFAIKEDIDQNELVYEMMFSGVKEEEMDSKSKKELYDYFKEKGINVEKYFDVYDYSFIQKLEPFIVQDAIDLLDTLGYNVSVTTQYNSEVAKQIRAFRIDNNLGESDHLDQRVMQYLLGKAEYRGSFFAAKTNSQLSKSSELSLLGSFLFDWHQSHSYQKGTYYGAIQGTEIGMNLYYTDLVMKLWSMDFRGTAPTSDHMDGFLPIVNSSFDFTQYEDDKYLSGTRSWLAPLEQSYKFHSAIDKVYFSSSATRIFNASNSDKKHGKETSASFRDYQFANWWNKNYLKVADYEQEYHKLNQIMKWSLITRWLKMNNSFKFLNQITYQKNLDFEDWYNKNKNLKVNVPLPFVEVNEPTESLNMISSKPYFPYSDEAYMGRFSGGVSAGTVKDVQKSLGIKPVSEIQQSNLVRKGGRLR